jgi:hypothetical protein
MSQGIHTPGPWHNQSTNCDYGPRHVCGPKHTDGGDYAPICIANTEANARLIAAAPELLLCLRDCMDALDRAKTISVRKQWEVMSRAENVINKALGK